MKHWLTLISAMALAALPAQARFGHSGGSSHSSSSGSHASSSSSHAAVPVGSGSRTGSTGAGNSSGHGYVSSGYGYGSGYGPYGYGFGYNPWRYGYFSGAYIPLYGYGYGYWVGPSQYGVSGTSEPIAREAPGLRITTGIEAMTYVTGDPGVTVGIHGHVEGENWGFFISGQNIAVKSPDSGSFDTIQQVSARVTYAFLSGRYGRLRAELGGDSVFTREMTALGPTGGLSGSLWIGGPVALEGSVMVTPVPFFQLDYKVGVAVGVGPVGLRAGWRTQTLDDRGVVDGIAHRDTFMGPYVGASMVF